MIRFIRERSQIMLWALVIVVVLSFSLWGSYNYVDNLKRTPSVGKIGGRTIALPEFQEALRATFASLAMATGRLPQRGGQWDEMLQGEAWQRLLFLREADRLGVIVSDDAVAESLRDHPLFRNEKGQFDSKNYREFVARALPNLGLNESSFHELIRSERKIERVVAAITSGSSVTEDEVQDRVGRLFGPTTIQVLEWRRDAYTKAVALTEDDIKNAYEQGLSRFSSPEKRKVSYVVFELSSEQQKLKDEARAKALSELGEKAVDFTVALLGDNVAAPPAFAEVARQKSLSVHTEEALTAQDKFPGADESGSLVTQAAFRLSRGQRDSDVIAAGSKFYVLHLLDIQAPTPKPLEQVKAQVQAELTAQKASDAMLSAANNARAELVARMEKGEKFEDAAAALKLKIRTLSPFVPAAQTASDASSPEAPFKGSAASLSIGTLGEVQSVGDGVAIIRVVSRGTPAPKPEELQRVRDQLTSQKRQRQLREWMLSVMREKGTEFNLPNSGMQSL
jgi:hypothetical protein